MFPVRARIEAHSTASGNCPAAVPQLSDQSHGGEMRGVITGSVLALFMMAPCTRQLVAQGPPPQSQQMAEAAFKNVQVLKGMSVGEFMEVMGIFSASTLLNCTDCHTSASSGNWAKYADDTPLKRTARRMVTMVR